MAPVTDFAVKEKYEYLAGLGNYHQSEALPGAVPLVNNSPQKPPYGFRTERISGTSFTAPRHETLQVWLYRTVSSLEHTEFIPYEEAPPKPNNFTPNSYMWPSFPSTPNTDWLQQRLLAKNGDAASKKGVSIWLFSIDKDMSPRTAFSSLDGDVLIIPQAGTLDIQTELGKMLVRQNEIAVIPRGVRYRVTLPAGPARGYVAELHEGHYRLPDLGAIGSTGLANVRDFQIPKAYFEGKLEGDRAVPTADEDWTIVSRLAGRLWSCTQDHTPFDVAAWHGTNYPVKYDLARFCVLGNVLFDEHDPSMYVVFTAPSREAGHAVVDFAIIPPRWQVAEQTFWPPYFHRNTCSEFFGPIVNAQDPEHPLNASSPNNEFFPFGAGLNGGNTTHGAGEADFQSATNAELQPKKLANDGMTVFLLETENSLYVADWAEQAAIKNFTKPKETAKI